MAGRSTITRELDAGKSVTPLLLPLALKWGSEARLPLPAVIERISSRPAALLGIAAGHLAPGAVADVCIFDPEADWRVEPASLKSQGKNTPFIGLELPGVVKATVIDGHVDYEGR